MYYSFFEIFSIGVGPSSSHTVGPMRAAKRWLDNLRKENLFEKVAKVEVTLYGSLGAGLAVWGVINLLEGYGSDNPAANAHVP